MTTWMIITYVLIAILFFIIGQMTTRPEDGNVYLAGLASIFWPISVVAVLCYVLWCKFIERNSSRLFS
jgi:hypothetical protein